MASRKKREVKIQKYIAVIFLVFLGVFLVGNLLMPTKTYSEAENRSLSDRPAFTWSSVLTGSYAGQYEQYQSDQFVGREFFRKLRVGLGRIAGHKEENGIFYGKQSQLIEKIAEPQEENIQANLLAIQTFAQQHTDLNISMLLVPDVATIYPEKLPMFAETGNQTALLKRVRREMGDFVAWIDVSETFAKHADEKLYYQTDSRWTSLGAYYAFQAAGTALEIDSSDMTNFVPYAVTTEFNGMLSAKSGYLQDVKEEIDIYVPSGKDISVLVNYVDRQEKRTSLFYSEKLKERDKYQVFLGGEDSLVDIKTTADSTRRLLIFKDSSANCFVQFLIPYFREIVLVDARYYAGDAEELLDTYHATDVLFLYRGNSFFRDNQLSGVLASE